MQAQRFKALIDALAENGLTPEAMTTRTPNGRGWEITLVKPGRTRFPDGRWGDHPNAPGGFRLFEIADDGFFEEHDSPNGVWGLAELVGYLEHIGSEET